MSRPDPVTREMSPCNGGTERFPACHGRCPKDERTAACQHGDALLSECADRRAYCAQHAGADGDGLGIDCGG